MSNVSKFWPLFFLLTNFGASPLLADEQWNRMATKHFEMYTTNDADHATAALQVFEQVRSFFVQSNQAAGVPDLPVKIIAFRSEGEYARYRLNPGAFAYYLHNYKHDYIVMQDINPEHYPAVIHEYTHLIVEHSGWKLPLWLNEGWAEVYSSLQSQGNKVVVGRVPVGRLADLRAGDWLSLQTILAVDHKSPYYQQPDKMRLFYAQSWALCHMLMLSPAYKPKFLSFVAAVSAGRPAADCFSAIYGKTLDQVQGDLTEYIGRAAQQTELLDVQLSSSESQPAVSPLSSFDRDLALSDLLGASAQTAGEARSLLTQLSKEQPGNAEVEESMGYLTWQQGNEQEVRLHFRRAFQNGSNDAVMLCEYASLVEASVQGDIAEGDSARSALLKALALQPNYIDARLQFALMEFRAGRYESASANLTLIKTVKPEQAYCYYSALAYSDYRLGKLEDARLAATSAKEYANSPAKQQHCLSLLTRLDASRRRPEVLGSLLPLR